MKPSVLLQLKLERTHYILTPKIPQKLKMELYKCVVLDWTSIKNCNNMKKLS